MLTLPADNGTWGVGIIASAKDTAMRSLKDVDVWADVDPEHAAVRTLVGRVNLSTIA